MKEQEKRGSNAVDWSPSMVRRGLSSSTGSGGGSGEEDGDISNYGDMFDGAEGTLYPHRLSANSA
jgi:hypothetical protein